MSAVHQPLIPGAQVLTSLNNLPINLQLKPENLYVDDLPVGVAIMIPFTNNPHPVSARPPGPSSVLGSLDLP